MDMTAQTLDMIVALLTIPAANKVLENAPTGKWGPHEYQQIVDSYFELRRHFQKKFWAGVEKG